MTSDMLLRVNGLKTYFYTSVGVVKAVDGLDFDIRRGETVGLVGESGSGKSVTALSILRLVPDPPGRIVAGQAFFEGTDLLKLTEEQMREIRGGRIAMSFQDPMTYLNPVMKVGDQIAEAIMLHQKLVKKSDAMEKAIEAMTTVHIPSPSARAKDYPHQLSGGMRQRVLLAIAVACRPKLLIADEPTTALDLIIQNQILGMLEEMQRGLELSLLLITHDLGIVAAVSQRVAIMYAGELMEFGSTKTIFTRPLHPYTKGLLESLPTVEKKEAILRSIEGTIPDLISPPSGCRFHPRCNYAMTICREELPPTEVAENDHVVHCHRWDELDAQ